MKKEYDYSDIKRDIRKGITDFLLGKIDGVNFEIQDNGDFLLIQILMKDELFSRKLEEPRVKVGELIHSLFIDSKLPYNWMAVFVLNDEVIESVYSDLSGEKEFT